MDAFQKQVIHDIRECARSVDGIRVGVDDLRESIDKKFEQFRESIGVQFDALRRDTNEDRNKLDSRIQKIEVDLAKDAKDTEGLRIFRDGTNGDNGAAKAISELKAWQSRAIGVTAALAVAGTIALGVFTAWLTSYLDTKSAERIAAATAQTVPAAPAAPAATTHH